MNGGPSLTTVPVRATRSPVGTVLQFGCLYVAFGATFGVIGTGATLVFRAHGVPLAAIGLLQLVSLPIGVTFLWAPLIDRLRWPALPHRLGWIAAGQTATAALLLVLSRGSDWPAPLLFALALGIAVCLATMDVALEALVVETVTRAERPRVTTAKLVGSSLGTAAGIALVTTWPQVVDLPRAVLVTAVLDLAMLAPILLYPEAARRLAAGAHVRTGPAWSRLRVVGGRAVVLGLYFATALLLSGTASLALVDLGVALPVVGLVTGPASTALSVGAMLLAGFALTRASARKLVLVLAPVVAAATLTLAAAYAVRLAGLAVVATLVHVAFNAALGVPVFNVIYRWAEGDHAATDYAVLFGAAFLVSFPVRIVGPLLAAELGWPLFFALGAPLYLAAAIILARAMSAGAARAA